MSINNIEIPFKDGTQSLQEEFLTKDVILRHFPHLLTKSTSAGYGLAVGGIYTWGQNNLGQLGNGNTTNNYTPTKINIAVDFKKISVGHNHVLAIAEDDTLWGWGDNVNGQLAKNPSTSATILTPTKLSDLKWQSIACGLGHSVGITKDGSLYAWGINSRYQIPYVPAGGSPALQYNSPQLQNQGPIGGWLEVKCGNDHNMALRSDGYLYTWGDNTYGQLCMGVLNPSRSYTPTQIYGGNYDSGDCLMFSCGIYHSVVVKKSDGSLWGWGANNYYPLLAMSALGMNPSVTGSPSAVQIAPFGDPTFWLDIDATNNTFGIYNSTLLPSTPSTLRLISNNSVIAKETGTLWKKWSYFNYDATKVAELALTYDGKLWFSGNNRYGLVGSGSAQDTNIPSLSQIGDKSNYVSYEISKNGKFCVALAINDWQQEDVGLMYQDVGGGIVDVDTLLVKPSILI